MAVQVAVGEEEMMWEEAGGKEDRTWETGQLERNVSQNLSQKAIRWGAYDSGPTQAEGAGRFGRIRSTSKRR